MAWGDRGRFGGGFRPYVPVADRQQRASKQVTALMKAAGRAAAPVLVERRRDIAATFWGRAWCENLERYGDFANRLPRGRSYLRNGSVMDLHVEAGRVTALVAGSELYVVTIELAKLAPARWKAVIQACTGRIASLIGLLRGELSPEVLAVLVAPGEGLFPTPQEIAMSCTCPDWATMCKHVAATLYGVGARLDSRPELFFVLRQVDQRELLQVDPASALRRGAGVGKRLARANLGAMFGIDLDVKSTKRPSARERRRR